MFKKTLGFVTVAAAVVSLGLASATTANAADTTPASTSESTTATVNLTPGDTSTGANGITLSQVPNITFAEQKLTGSAIDSTGTLSGNNVVVTNPGIAGGWTVALTASKMTNDAGNSLLGASYTLTSKGAQSVKDDLSTPVAKADGSDITAVSNTVTVGGDGSVSGTIMSATAQQVGSGIWNANYDDSSTLSIPSQAVAGEYKQDLTWTLSNTPVA